MSREGFESFIFNLDLGTILPPELVSSYTRRGDELGLACVMNMTSQVGQVVNNFKLKLEKYQEEGRVTDIYLEKHALGKKRRLEPSSIALLLSLFSFVISTSGLVVTESQIYTINRRLDTLSRYLDQVRETQTHLNTNIEFLYENQKFVGAETALVVDYVNNLKLIYSCDYLENLFSHVVTKLETRLIGIFQSILDRKLSLNLLDRDEMDKITSNVFFGDTIYLFNPSTLYEYSNLDFVSLKGNKLTLLVSFPIIKRTFSYRRVNILESPANLIIQKQPHERFASFLLPIHVPLENITQHLGDLRAGHFCILNSRFEACEVGNLLDYVSLLCVIGVINDNDENCPKQNTFVFDYNVQYSQGGALIYLKNDAEIIETTTGDILYKGATNDSKCVYLRPKRNLMVKSIFRQEYLFPKKGIFEVFGPNLDIFLPKLTPVSNFSIPERPTVKKYIPISFEPLTEFNIWLYIAIGSCTIVILFIIGFLVYLCKRHRVVDGQNLYPNRV